MTTEKQTTANTIEARWARGELTTEQAMWLAEQEETPTDGGGETTDPLADTILVNQDEFPHVRIGFHRKTKTYKVVFNGELHIFDTLVEVKAFAESTAPDGDPDPDGGVTITETMPTRDQLRAFCQDRWGDASIADRAIDDPDGMLYANRQHDRYADGDDRYRLLAVSAGYANADGDCPRCAGGVCQSCVDALDDARRHRRSNQS